LTLLYVKLVMIKGGTLWIFNFIVIYNRTFDSSN
jgi:hypothetical protein